MNVPSSFICNTPKLESSPVSFTDWTGKQTAEPSHHGTLCRTTDTGNNLGESPERDAEGKSLARKVRTHHLMVFMWHSWNDKIIEMERLVEELIRRLGCSYNRAAGGIFVMEHSGSWPYQRLRYCLIVVVQYVTTEKIWVKRTWYIRFKNSSYLKVKILI